jgi:RIO kinase 1
VSLRRKKVEKKVRRKEKSYETKQLMKDKRSDEYEVLEEVLDRSTLITLYDFKSKGTISEIYGAVKAGKESKVYWGKDADGKDLAIKIYLTVSAEFKRGMLVYIEGDPRFSHVRRDQRSLVYTWAQKEFKNLQRAFNVGIAVPRPIAVKKNVLIIEFIGENGFSAPLMKEAPPKNPKRTFLKLLACVKKLYQKAELVHADLSEYNIMMWRGRPIVFDFSQAVSIEHPMADEFLRRDLKNLHTYFIKLGVDVPPIEEMYRRVADGKN